MLFLFHNNSPAFILSYFSNGVKFILLFSADCCSAIIDNNSIFIYFTAYPADCHSVFEPFAEFSPFIRGFARIRFPPKKSAAYPASLTEDSIISLPGIVEAFVRQNLSVLPEEEQVYQGFSAHPIDTQNNTDGATLRLQDYVTAIFRLSEELQVTVVDNYSLEINETNYPTYLSDLVHPNERGRFLFAQNIIREIRP